MTYSMYLNFVLIFILTSFSLSTFGKKEVYVLHPQLVWLLKEHPEFQKNYNLKEPLSKRIDPHHFDPSTNDIKRILKAPLLITGPLSHSPWLKTILEKRSKENTFYVKALSTQDNSFTQEAKDHFWLYSDGVCEVSKDVYSFLKLSDHHKPCNQVQAIEQEMGEILKAKKYSIIVTHPSLNLFLEKLSIPYFTLSSGGHHQTIKPQALKELKKWQTKQSHILWVIEENHNIPSNLISKNHKMIKFFPFKNTPSFPLHELLIKIKEVL